MKNSRGIRSQESGGSTALPHLRPTTYHLRSQESESAYSLPPTVYRLLSIVLLYRVTYAISANKPDRLLSIIAQLVNSRVKSRIYRCTFCRSLFVFMHIAGSIFIFNISKGQRPVSDLDQRVNDPLQWGALRKSAIDNRKSAAGWNLPFFARSTICCPSKLGAGARKRHSLPTALHFPSSGS